MNRHFDRKNYNQLLRKIETGSMWFRNALAGMVWYGSLRFRKLVYRSWIEAGSKWFRNALAGMVWYGSLRFRKLVYRRWIDIRLPRNLKASGLPYKLGSLLLQHLQRSQQPGSKLVQSRISSTGKNYGGE